MITPMAFEIQAAVPSPEKLKSPQEKVKRKSLSPGLSSTESFPVNCENMRSEVFRTEVLETSDEF